MILDAVIVPDHLHFVAPCGLSPEVLGSKPFLDVSEVVNGVVGPSWDDLWNVIRDATKFKKFVNAVVDPKSKTSRKLSIGITDPANLYIKFARALHNRPERLVDLLEAPGAKAPPWADAPTTLPLCLKRLQRVVFFNRLFHRAVESQDNKKTFFFLEEPVWRGHPVRDVKKALVRIKGKFLWVEYTPSVQRRDKIIEAADHSGWAHGTHQDGTTLVVANYGWFKLLGKGPKEAKNG